MTDGPEDYSRNLDDCPLDLANAFHSLEKWLKKSRRLRNKGQQTDGDVERARAAFELIRESVAEGNWRSRDSST